MNLKEFADEHGIKENDVISLDGKTIGRVDLREQQFNEDGSPIPFDTPRYHCPICHNKIFKLPIVYKKNGKWVVSGEFVFHCSDTHGIPKELIDIDIGYGLYSNLREILKLLYDTQQLNIKARNSDATN